ncbi:RDD family protein [Paenarthrobacter nitroguajacolicus]|uniref:RDD family protein n=1 Tax=Paenarthrobacter nitroguajacolicus TaxID=211146 RepID=A0A558GMX9_PAENT|nr:RDD family protein [Paenarthrobacter nitroguajacolicus]TVU58252.1 RDD family protein [Paenarthrobacter nitroguajacolicus]
MTTSKSTTATGLVDAATGRPVRRHPDTGAYFVKASGSAHFWGRALDALVFLVGYVVLAVIAVMARESMMNSGSMLGFNDGFWLTLYVVLWFVGLFAYGMIWGTAGSVGDAAAGMRSVRIKDGTTAGAWLGGWRAICWSFFPFFVVMVIASALSGGSGDTWDPKFAAVDRRSGLAQGQPPVPDPKIVASQQAADAEQQNLPNLYGQRPDARP